MKTLVTVILILISFITSSHAQTSSATTNSATDETAVKQAIADETQAFMTRNQSQWEILWMHAPYISWSSERTPSQLLGWQAIKQGVDYNFVAGQPARPGIAFQRDQYQIHILNNLATDTIIQTSQTADGRTLGKSIEVRVLENRIMLGS